MCWVWGSLNDMENEFLEIFAVDTLATHQAYDTGTYRRHAQMAQTYLHCVAN